VMSSARIDSCDPKELILTPMTELLAAIRKLEELPIDERITAINELRAAIHAVSPFKAEPVDFVRWSRLTRYTQTTTTRTA